MSEEFLGEYNPDRFVSNDDDGIGVRPSGKMAVPMLRLFAEQGSAWLVWHCITGGCEGDNWFELFYHGLLRLKDAYRFGHWVIRIEGEGLEKLKQDMANHIRVSLRPGKTASSTDPIIVRSISIGWIEADGLP